MGGKSLASSGVVVGGGVASPTSTSGGPASSAATEEDEEDEDDGGFRPKPGNTAYRTNPALITEQSSLAANKMTGSKYSVNSNQSPNHQLPILNLNQEPGTNSNNSTNTNNSHGNVTLSSTTTMSNRLANNEQIDKRFKNLNDYTTSAHEFLTQSISQNALNHIDSSNESTKNMNSPSNKMAEFILMFYNPILLQEYPLKINPHLINSLCILKQNLFNKVLVLAFTPRQQRRLDI